MKDFIRNTFSMLIVSALMIFGFVVLYNNQSDTFNTINKLYNDKKALNLNNQLNKDGFKNFLVVNNYVEDYADADLISQWFVDKLTRPGYEMANLGEMNKNAFKIPAMYAVAEGGKSLKERVSASQDILGLTDTIRTLYCNKSILPNFVEIDKDGDVITVEVAEKDSTRSKFAGIILGDKRPVSGVIVRLRNHGYEGDSAFIACDEETYAITDGDGVAKFKVKKDHYYSVLPIQEYYEFGSSKGTRSGKPLSGDETYSFTRKEHKITPFSSRAYMQIKSDGALTVRTPEQYRDSLLRSIVFYIGAWWLLFFFLLFMDAKKKMKDKYKISSDHFLLPLMMVLTGICLLAMYSIADPLTDRLLGSSMGNGVLFGVIAMALLSSFDFIKFYNGNAKIFGIKVEFDFVMQFLRWVAIPFSEKVEKIKEDDISTFSVMRYYRRLAVILLCWPVELIVRGINVVLSPIAKKLKKPIQWPNGIGYMLLVLILVILLFLFGTGPEGSGAKVNLFFFQPSELSKYLVIFFIAAFFALNADKMQEFVMQEGVGLIGRGRTVIIALMSMMMLLLFYLVLISDMGPALVLVVTFLIIYSIARRDFWQLLIGVASFIFIVKFAAWLNDTLATRLLAAGLWFVVWVTIPIIKKSLGKVGHFYESAVFMNLLLCAFMFGGEIMLECGMSEGQRLADRNAISWSGVWDNEVRGGDQVAQGIWSLTAGGVAGQGLGQGNPNVVPAFHTDMIFTSIGEELGWVALVLIIACLAALIHRSILLGRRTGNRFAFFLATGIALVTGVQFLVIVFGSIGVIPLTGVAVPFLSYGMTSLIINLAAYGIILSISRSCGTQTMSETFSKTYDGVLVKSLYTLFGFGLFLVCILCYYQFLGREHYMLKPALITNTQGARIVEYNPRISLLINKMHAGNIYDRNGLLIATSVVDSLDHIFKEKENRIYPDAIKNIVEAEKKKSRRRYYPFGEHLFFMLGDYNTRTMWNNDDSNPYGYMAENRHLANLRGFDNSSNEEPYKLRSKSFRENVYSPAKDTVFTYYKRDYSNDSIVAMLEEGIGGSLLKKWNEDRHSRDLHLTIDARLQTMLQTRMDEAINGKNGQNYGLSNQNIKVRASVVILNAQNGDLLCAANYPLPNQDTLQYLTDNKIHNYYDWKEELRKNKAYTDRDLAMTYQTAPGSDAKIMSSIAGFMKDGLDMTKKSFYVHEEEQIHEDSRTHTCNVSLKKAIVFSSNCYFINLVNSEDLYDNLDSLYYAVGIRLDIDKNGYISNHANNKSPNQSMKEGSLTPYFFLKNQSIHRSEYMKEIHHVGNAAKIRYNNYKESLAEKGKPQRMIPQAWGWAWGQGSMSASPLNMARVVSIVANDGKFVPTRYVKQMGETEFEPNDAISFISPEKNAILKSYMQAEAASGATKTNAFGYMNINNLFNGREYSDAEKAELKSKYAIGGKTGTPEREWRSKYNIKNGELLNLKKTKTGKLIYNKQNDGWYIFFVYSNTEDAPLAIATRIERCNIGSSDGVRMAGLIIDVLEDAGYKVKGNIKEYKSK